jgi:hypothetical protein
MNKPLLTAALVASVLLPVSTSALILDHFTTPNNFGITATVASPTATTGNVNAGPTVLGDYRYVRVDLAGGSLPIDVAGDMNVSGSGTLSFSAKAGTRGDFYLNYEGSAGTGFTAQDLTFGGGLGIYVDFLENDASAKVYVFAKSGANASYSVFNQVAPGVVFFPFATGWTTYAGSGATFSAITGLDFWVAGTENGDYTIDFIETRDRPPGVPDAGGTMMLLSIGVGLLGVARWKMNA